MTTVAVAPFVNLSAERVVDGRRFALAYSAELQKIPGYQVIPVGVTEQAMVDLKIDLDSPEDAVKLAKSLGADAIVIGAVTDYTPYYPPRIGLQVSWYSPEPHRFSPGIPTDPQLGDAVRVWRFASSSSSNRDEPVTTSDLIVRAQSPDSPKNSQIIACEATSEIANGPVLLGPNAPTPPALRVAAASSTVQTTAAESSSMEASPTAADPIPAPPMLGSPASAPSMMAPTEAAMRAPVPMQPLFPPANCPPMHGEYGGAYCPLPNGPAYADVYGGGAAAQAYDPIRPIMSYTRLFDGSDADLTALLRDYVILSGDLRSGGWEAYLHRTEDFIRFSSHRMIVEMLTLHGGESRRHYVWMLNKHRR